MAQLIASRYEVGPLLGAGGMARVVRGRDTRLDRPVAIKLVPAAAIDPVGRERFGREARSSAGFAHPNAVTAFDAGESDGYLYLVMELVDGSSLAELLNARGPLPIDDALHIEDSILAALGAAHAAGIVHRDVKPGNVLLGDHRRVKLADFGIARRLDDLTSDLTGDGRFIGTPKYLAPEQLAGEPATPRSDLYGAGVVLYEMLAGAPPFDAPSPIELAWAHHHAPVPDVRTVRPDVPAAVAATIATAMAKDPADRFATAEAMRRSLSEPSTDALPPTAVLAAPVHPATAIGATTGRPRSRRPLVWLVVLAVLLAIAIGGFVLSRDGDTADPPATTVANETTTASATTSPTTTVPATTSPPTTQPPVTTAATTTIATTLLPEFPQSLEELIEQLVTDPELFGDRATDLRDDLADLDNRADRAQRALDRATEWTADGELNEGVLPALQNVLAPIVAQGDNNSGNGGDDDGGGGDD